MNALTVTVRADGAWAVLEVAGDLDHHTAPQIRDAVQAQALGPGRGLVLDLGGLTFCDSSGITAVVVARALARDADAAVVLAALPDRVARIFALVGLTEVFTVHRTTAEAVAAPPVASF